MSKVKIIRAGLALLLIFSLLPGCSNLRYGARLYNHVNDWIDESFLKENRVKAYYPNDNYVYGENDRLIYEETAPSSRVFIITDEDEYNGIFTASPLDVDFETEMVILHIFSNTSPRDYKLKRKALREWCSRRVICINRSIYPAVRGGFCFSSRCGRRSRR